MRVKHGPYLKTNFRVHSFLAGVPLYDVWAVMLHTRGGPRTMDDLKRVLAALFSQPVDPLVLALFRVRGKMGRMFGWEASTHRSQASVGGVVAGTGMREVYSDEQEMLLEAVSNVAHVFLLLAMEPVAEGYVLHVAVYVKRTGWFTPVYMKLIDPFRRFIVYPILIHDLEQAWADVYAKPPSQQPRTNQRPRR